MAQREVRRNDLLPQLFACACVLFGLLHILNVHPTGDGLWFWYAKLFREGHHLYGDMHLNLPPFFVLVTAATQAVFGTSWLASKVPAVLQLLVYTSGLYLLSAYLQVRAALRGLLIATAFLFTLAVSYARFDDYHMPTHICVVFSAWLLLRYRERAHANGEWLLAICLGFMGGLSLGNRLNDGATLVTAQLMLLPLFVRRSRLAATGLFLAVVPVTLALLVLSTGDSLHNWYLDTVIRAAAIKGGTGSILKYPFLLAPRQAWLLISVRYQTALLGFFLFATAILSSLGWRWRRVGTWRDAKVLGGFGGFLLLMAVVGYWMRNNALTATAGSLGIVVGTVLVLTLVFVAVRQIITAGLQAVDPVPLLLLLPFAQLLGAAMTSGDSAPEYTPAIGLMLLMLPICEPRVRSGLPGVVLASATLLLVSYGTVMKAVYPYRWHHYFNEPMFSDREWYHHPAFGPMYIETKQVRLMEDLCSPVQQSGPNTTLLSLPYPYGNYFCNIAPWHGYVQLWYDTASKSTIDKVIADLRIAPPEWIIYERGLDSLTQHELVFFHGRPLPHRALDALIVSRIRSRAWTMTSQRCYNGADWIEIHTVPPTPGTALEDVNASDSLRNLCSRTEHAWLP